jgi:hypothetical protein
VLGDGVNIAFGIKAIPKPRYIYFRESVHHKVIIKINIYRTFIMQRLNGWMGIESFFKIDEIDTVALLGYI